jgi:hypothetical protein
VGLPVDSQSELWRSYNATLGHVLPADPDVARIDLDDARAARAYWMRRARSLPWYRLRERREAVELAQRWESRVDRAARDTLLLAPRAALGAILEVRRDRARRLVHRTARVGVVAVGATAVAAGVAADAAWHLLTAIV